jgi:hypothetical protein
VRRLLASARRRWRLVGFIREGVRSSHAIELGHRHTPAGQRALPDGRRPGRGRPRPARRTLTRVPAAHLQQHHDGHQRGQAEPGDARLGARHHQLNYGWWTVLEPHLTRSDKRETKAVREQARKNLEDENNALLAKLRQMRGQQ